MVGAGGPPFDLLSSVLRPSEGAWLQPIVAHQRCVREVEAPTNALPEPPRARDP